MKDSQSVNNTVEISPKLLQQLTMQQEQYRDDEIDLAQLWHAIWAGKWLIIAITALFAIASVFYALSLPNIYKSQALLAPAEQQSGGLGGMASQLGGLASLAGVNLGSGKTDKTALALEIMKSRAFVFKFIEKHELTVPLMAAKGWNMTTNQLIYDREIYDAATKQWLRQVKAPLQPKPSLQESYQEFNKIVSISQDKTSAMVSISIEHYSPYVAKQWVEWLIDAINHEMKIRDLTEAENSVTYLNTQLENTKVADVKIVLYQLIEEQTKTIMFANVRQQYILRTIDPAFSPEIPSEPNKLLIIIISTLLGFLLSIPIVLVSTRRNTK